MKKLKANRHYIVHNVCRVCSVLWGNGACELAKEVHTRFEDGYDIYRSLKLYCDNNPAVCYAHNNKSSGATKHIDIKYYVVKDKVRDHIISLEHIRTEKMLVDLLTKDLPPSVFREHVASLSSRKSLWFLNNKGLVKNLFQNREVHL